MKILLTGSSSDIGLKLTNKLIENIENFSEVSLLVNTSSISEKIKIDNHKKIKLIRQNLLDPFSNELKKILDTIDILIHFAWIRPKNPKKSYRLNVEVTNKILGNLNKNSKIIFLSSVAGIPESLSYYGKSKFEISKKLYSSYETSILLSGLIITDNKNSPFQFLKKFFEKILVPIKFGSKIKILFNDSSQVVDAVYDKIINFKKGIFGLYNNEHISIDDFAENNFKRKGLINISFFLNLFLKISKYINSIPLINGITDKLITLITNDKLKTDEFIRKGF